MSTPRNLTILGATGSIGTSTLDLVRRHPDRFGVFALTANRNIELIAAQCLEFSPLHAVVGTEEGADQLRHKLLEAGLKTNVSHGEEALIDIAAADESDTLVSAIVGAAGLLPTLAGIKGGKKVLLANKEALVCSGRLFMDAVVQSGALLLPVDSEHNAIFQTLQGQDRGGVNKLLLTASGGPFLRFSQEQLQNVTPEQACAHPNWNMGAKISVDSATMMNKGLEVIEARWLFGCPADQIEVVVHPESIVHSMVEYCDGSILAQMGNPDMRVPLANVLGWPDRITSGVPALDFGALSALRFEKPDLEQFPCLGLAIQAAHAEADYPLFLNAANEVAVQAFLNDEIGYTDIYRVNSEVMEKASGREPESIEAVLEQDVLARRIASRQLEQLS